MTTTDSATGSPTLPRTAAPVLRVRPAAAAPLTRPAMSHDVDAHHRVALTSGHVLLDGRPVIPVSGEMHYSRVPRERWDERLRILRASGVTIVSSYVIWIHHQPTEAAPRFEDDLDVAGFVRLAAEAGLQVMLRIGPWVHGEVRGGGLPDWLLGSGVRSRTDDAGYLRQVAAWFGALGEQLVGLCGPDSPIVGIQLENELYDQPGHLLTLKRLAREAGLTAPIWTATAWGGAVLPAEEVLPVYGGYVDGFWVDADAGWDDSFRQHLQFSRQWDDPGIGADLRTVEAARREPDPAFPLVTCELGGGMASAYHRRPVTHGRDIAAVANAKLGSGSVWQGFYMYVGGLNPTSRDGFQESHASGYPNDLPRVDYDFRSPLGATGAAGESLPAMREHNAFLAAFGSRLAPLPSALPDAMPTGPRDAATLRWALRGDADEGFLFVNWHQPHELLATHPPVRFAIEGEPGLELPDVPVAIPAGTIARWPVGLRIGGVRIAWATASAVTVLDGAVPTLVLRAHRGIPATVAIEGRAAEEVELNTAIPVRTAEGAVDLLVLDQEALERTWVIDGRLLRSATPLWADPDGLRTRSAIEPRVEVWRGGDAGFRRLEAVALGTAAASRDLAVTPVRAATAAPRSWGERDGRASAPTPDDVTRYGAVFELASIGSPGDADVVIVIDWSGDVAQLRAGDRLIADRFGDGTPWEIRLTPREAAGPLQVLITPRPSDVRIAVDAEIPVDPIDVTMTARVELRGEWALRGPDRGGED